MFRSVPYGAKCQCSPSRSATSIRSYLPLRQKNLKNNKLNKHNPHGLNAKRKENDNQLKKHVPTSKLIRNALRISPPQL